MYDFSTNVNVFGSTISRPDVGSVTRAKLPLGTMNDTTQTITITIVRMMNTCGI